MVFLRENDRRHHFKTNVFMVILKESDTQHHFKNIFFKMYKKWQATKLVDLLQVDLLASGASLFWPQSGPPRATKSREVPRHMKSDEGLFWKSTKLAVFELKMLLFTMMTEELNWEHRTWRLRFLGPASFLCKLQNETNHGSQRIPLINYSGSAQKETLVPVDSLHVKFTPVVAWDGF